ncbi:hypothetical protein [Aequorivita echinoideorum]|uniref:Lipoprotein n=1 Tax=Aequorivita echinoideorum TaxID=1549647 RepID=A0ABS5S639_9FLAO|nr:hypothetical protein [Aequorivita echinoideorum]MBT0607889.1 hypothetical protein [Aequorivita echinoideorum]
MKKIVFILCAVLLNMGLFSCTPQTLSEETKNTQACCGDDGDLPPPPPPPPPYTGG